MSCSKHKTHWHKQKRIESVSGFRIILIQLERYMYILTSKITWKLLNKCENAFLHCFLEESLTMCIYLIFIRRVNNKLPWTCTSIKINIKNIIQSCFIVILSCIRFEQIIDWFDIIDHEQKMTKSNIYTYRCVCVCVNTRYVYKLIKNLYNQKIKNLAPFWQKLGTIME